MFTPILAGGREQGAESVLVRIDRQCSPWPCAPRQQRPGSEYQPLVCEPHDCVDGCHTATLRPVLVQPFTEHLNPPSPAPMGTMSNLEGNVVKNKK
jgi:hypothetical protein